MASSPSFDRVSLEVVLPQALEQGPGFVVFAKQGRDRKR